MARGLPTTFLISRPVRDEEILLLGGPHHGRTIRMPPFPGEFMVSFGDRLPYSRDDRLAVDGAVAFPYNFSTHEKIQALGEWFQQAHSPQT